MRGATWPRAACLRVPGLAVAVACIVAASPASALMVKLSLEQIAAGSSSVATGTVARMESRWTPDGYTIVTDVSLRIAEDWAGKLPAGSEVVVRVLGGEVGDIGIRVEHQPVFRIGEDVLLFLEAGSDALYRVKHAEQGKFAVLGQQVVGMDGRAVALDGFRAAVERALPARER